MNPLLEELCIKSLRKHGLVLMDTPNRREYISGDLIFKRIIPLTGKCDPDERWSVRVRPELSSDAFSKPVTEEICILCDAAAVQYNIDKNRKQEYVYTDLLKKLED